MKPKSVQPPQAFTLEKASGYHRDFVEKCWKKISNKDYSIVDVHLVKSSYLMSQFHRREEELKVKDGVQPPLIYGFHGTAEENIDKILTSGFLQDKVTDISDIRFAKRSKFKFFFSVASKFIMRLGKERILLEILRCLLHIVR